MTAAWVGTCTGCDMRFEHEDEHEVRSHLHQCPADGSVVNPERIRG